ncbi:MAG: hypothetical protein ACHQ4H_00325 [Ktedonobacterales bacterium]
MDSQTTAQTTAGAERRALPRVDRGDASRIHDPLPGEMPCPVCGAPMPDLKGGKATICAVCGFKDSCCY